MSNSDDAAFQDVDPNIPASPQHTLSPAPKRSNPMKTLAVCRYYFLGGFFFLPCLWVVNVLWFFPEAFGRAELASGDEDSDAANEERSEPERQERRDRIRAQARRYVIVSGLGALAWAVILGVWTYLYQTRRSAWGAWGDELSAIIPRGKP